MRAAVLASALIIAAGMATTTAAAPGFWWWTEGQALKNVAAANVRTIRGQRLPIVKSVSYCKGFGAATAGRYRLFRCFLAFRKPDGLRTYEQVKGFWFRTSTKRRGAIACFVWSVRGEEIAGACPKV